jgi:hypothetical protein
MISDTRRLFVFAAVLSALISLMLPPVVSASSVVGPSWATKMVFYNASNADVVVMAVIQGLATGNNAAAQDGCPTNIRDLRYIDLTANGQPTSLTMFTNTSKGWFTLKRGHSAQLLSTTIDPLTHQQTYCLQGFNIGFQGASAACPQTPMPFPVTTAGARFNQATSVTPANGVNGFEGSVNMPGLIAGAFQPGTQEAVDITCLGGANAKLQMQITPPVGGPYWNFQSGPAAGGTINYTTTATFQNSWVLIPPPPFTAVGCDDNCVDPKTGLARPGVFPYGCSQCNAFPDPHPACGVSASPPVGGYPSQFCAAKNLMPSPAGGHGCQLQRNPLLNQQVQKFGGTIQVTYLGPLAPPASCPK